MVIISVSVKTQPAALALKKASPTSRMPSLVEVATQYGVRRERQEAGRDEPGQEPCHAGPRGVGVGEPPASGEEVRRGWVGRGAPSSDMPFLPSLRQADHPTPCTQPCTPRHHPEESDCPGTRAMLAAERHQAGLTGKLVGVARSEACITPAGIGCGLETGVT